MTKREKVKKKNEATNQAKVNLAELEKRNNKIRAELKYHVKIHKASVALVERVSGLEL